MGIVDDRPGPKRDDPKRIAALRENARRQVEAELFEQAKVLRRSGAQAKDMVRATREGRRAQVGVIVGEAGDGTCWVLKLANGSLTEYLKSHCERLKSHEAGKAIRQIRQQLKIETLTDKKVYGDGDI